FHELTGLLTLKQTKEGLLINLNKIFDKNMDLDNRWLELIEKRFLISKIGKYCIDKNISAGDLIQALKNMNFDDYFQENKGCATYSGTTFGSLPTTWYGFIENKEETILNDFENNLPNKRTPHIEPYSLTKNIKITMQEYLTNLVVDLQVTPFTVINWYAS